VTLTDLLVTCVDALEAEAIPYMLTGSVASALYGEPRTTMDIDFVIDPERAALNRFTTRLTTLGLYVDRLAAVDALRDRGQFNAIHDGSKVDFVIRKDAAFSRTEFARRRLARLPGIDAYVATVEDLILAKLAWAKASDSDRQRRDVEGMVALTGDHLDRPYIDDWARRLDLTAEWDRLSGSAPDQTLSP
jgi:hypothetical protein